MIERGVWSLCPAHLEEEDNVPDEAKNNGRVAVGNISSVNTHEFHLSG